MCDKNLPWESRTHFARCCDPRLQALRGCDFRSTIDYVFDRLLQIDRGMFLPLSLANRHRPQFMQHNDKFIITVHDARGFESAIELYNQPWLV